MCSSADTRATVRPMTSRARSSNYLKRTHPLPMSSFLPLFLSFTGEPVPELGIPGQTEEMRTTPDFCEASPTNAVALWDSRHNPPDTWSGIYQPIIPNCMPSSYPSGRFSVIALRTALSAAGDPWGVRQGIGPRWKLSYWRRYRKKKSESRIRDGSERARIDQNEHASTRDIGGDQRRSRRRGERASLPITKI